MIKHHFYGRQGGSSQGGYKSLNLSDRYGDDAASVQKNKEFVLNEAEGEFLACLDQVHGTKCLIVDTPYEGLPKADAFVTKKKGIVLGIVTADCAPVLFEGVDERNLPVIGAAHAGWRGAFDGVCEQTIEKMMVLGCLKETVVARIGPCIAQPSYEVSQEFYEQFIEQNEENSIFFIPSNRDEHFLFDLSKYITHRLNLFGITKVKSDNRDTYALEQEFFSFRRATHKGMQECGRQISTIVTLND